MNIGKDFASHSPARLYTQIRNVTEAPINAPKTTPVIKFPSTSLEI